MARATERNLTPDEVALMQRLIVSRLPLPVKLLGWRTWRCGICGLETKTLKKMVAHLNKHKRSEL